MMPFWLLDLICWLIGHDWDENAPDHGWMHCRRCWWDGNYKPPKTLPDHLRKLLHK